ncbi:ROK family protein [Sessilibacter corallicola]|uniref:ROK family protein n=1 Tax=Sessilibacter corallicola TaxID=2904075 RepID=UPI001E4D1B87|nr:ROK family protein [Sessilibacter corallicola]MCE2028923.1 ROK family protein [Sessilibacter corallicola]
MFGAIEAGGTKFVCAVGNSPDDIIESAVIDTTSPEKTMAQVKQFFQQQFPEPIRAIGLGAFGPICLEKHNENFGSILESPKESWSGFNIYRYLTANFKVPIHVTTDVNAALLGEFYFGIAKGLHSVVYLTVGTGIGGGAITNNRLISGISHPEFGHMMCKPHPKDIDFKGVCPYHGGHCFEGVASGPAIKARSKKPGYEISEDDELWDIEAYYLAQLTFNLVSTFAPQKVILGGGVMKQSHLFDRIRTHFNLLNKGYTQLDAFNLNVNELVSPVALDGNAGVMGCLYLAKYGFGKLVT